MVVSASAKAAIRSHGSERGKEHLIKQEKLKKDLKMSREVLAKEAPKAQAKKKKDKHSSKADKQHKKKRSKPAGKERKKSRE